MEELKKQRDLIELEYDKKIAYLGDEKAIEKINKVFKFEDKSNEYLIKHVRKAEEILSNIINSSLEKRFFDYDDIQIKWSSYIEIGENGHWDTTNNTMTIDCKYLLNKDEFKNGFNVELINTIQHELIHAFIAYKFKQLGLIIHTDASPVHQAIITYFNSRGCKIDSNDNLSNVFKLKQKALYDLAINKNITFVQLVNELDEWQEKLKIKLDQINNRKAVFKDFNEYVKIVPYFKDSNEYTNCNLISKNVSENIQIHVLSLELGMNCTVDKVEEKINKYIV